MVSLAQVGSSWLRTDSDNKDSWANIAELGNSNWYGEQAECVTFHSPRTRKIYVIRCINIIVAEASALISSPSLKSSFRFGVKLDLHSPISRSVKVVSRYEIRSADLEHIKYA